MVEVVKMKQKVNFDVFFLQFFKCFIFIVPG